MGLKFRIGISYDLRASPMAFRHCRWIRCPAPEVFVCSRGSTTAGAAAGTAGAAGAAVQVHLVQVHSRFSKVIQPFYFFSLYQCKEQR